jgi:hypothetical protein
MKTTIRLPIILSTLLLLIIATACTSGVQGRHEDQIPLDQVKTRDDALRAFGAPDNIAQVGKDTLYYFVSGLESGGGVGLGNYVWYLLFLGREHLVTDTKIVRVDAKGRVVSIERLDAQNIRRETIWPGD